MIAAKNQGEQKLFCTLCRLKKTVAKNITPQESKEQLREKTNTENFLNELIKSLIQ